MTVQSHTVQVSIHRTADEVYDFISNPGNMPQWAPGFCLSIKRTDKKDTWLITTTNGPVPARFIEKNNFRIWDHYVDIDGLEVYNAMRVLENKEGSEVTFTLFRLPHMNDEEFEADKAAVQKDMNSLKKVMEHR